MSRSSIKFAKPKKYSQTKKGKNYVYQKHKLVDDR